MERAVGGPEPALSALASLRRFARPRGEADRVRQRERERCGLCSAELGDEHSHLVEPATRKLTCACEPCAILFSGRADGRFRRVPRRVRALGDLPMAEGTWESLDLPINLAFFVRSTPLGRVVALYPSPAGATEASVPAESWDALVAENRALEDLEPDVEALLVNKLQEPAECYRLGIDECYRLVGLIRTHWSGFSGGADAWRAIARFFDGLRARAS